MSRGDEPLGLSLQIHGEKWHMVFLGILWQQSLPDREDLLGSPDILENIPTLQLQKEQRSISFF